jgi:hypothetical protein
MMHVRVEAVTLNCWGFRLKIYTHFHLPPTCSIHFFLFSWFQHIIIHIVLSLGSAYSAEYSFSLYSPRKVIPNFALMKTTGKVIMKVTNRMQLYRLIYFSLSALRVSSGFRSSSGALDCIYSIWWYWPRLLPAGVLMSWNSVSALHVKGDVFAHHQEHLTVFTVSGTIHPSCCRLVSWWVETPFQLYMFRAMFSLIIRSTWLYLQYLVFTQVAAGWCLDELKLRFSSTCFGRCFRPSSGALDCIYSIL